MQNVYESKDLSLNSIPVLLWFCTCIYFTDNTLVTVLTSPSLLPNLKCWFADHVPKTLLGPFTNITVAKMK